MKKSKKLLLLALFFPKITEACAGEQTGIENPFAVFGLLAITTLVFVLVRLKVKDPKLNLVLSILFGIILAGFLFILYLDIFVLPYTLCSGGKF